MLASQKYIPFSTVSHICRLSTLQLAEFVTNSLSGVPPLWASGPLTGPSLRAASSSPFMMDFLLSPWDHFPTWRFNSLDHKSHTWVPVFHQFLLYLWDFRTAAQAGTLLMSTYVNQFWCLAAITNAFRSFHQFLQRGSGCKIENLARASLGRNFAETAQTWRGEQPWTFEWHVFISSYHSVSIKLSTCSGAQTAN